MSPSPSSFHSVQVQQVCFAFILLLHVISPLTATAIRTIGGNETDRLALLAFKEKITYDPQGFVSSWNDSSHFCEWEGVICGRRHKRVIIIDIKSRGLAGTLSPYVGNLSFLRGFRLYNNTFKGEIPLEFGRLFRLRNLYLISNNFEGEIPTTLSRCSKLTHLDLSDNKLVGKIPKELSSLSKLLYLTIHKNNLSGEIPSFIGNLTSLESISAAQNLLGGSIPDALGQLRNLRELGLAFNNLYGMIPASIFNISSLTVLSLSANQLHGSLQSDIGVMLSHLQIFEIHLNLFTGPLPLSISNLTELQILDVGRNNFSGKMVVNFGGLKKIQKILMFGNNFGRGEPDEMSFINSMVNCSKLKVMTLGGNLLRGMLPTSLGIALVSCFMYWLLKKKRKVPSKGSMESEKFLRVSYRRLLKATNGFSPDNLIGAGSFGSVYKGIFDQEGSTVAVKVLNLLRHGAFKSFMAECETLRNIRHRNLLKIITSCSSVDFQGNDFRALVYEFMPNGSLERWLHLSTETNNAQNGIPSLSLLQRINIAVDVACALDYLHNHCQKTIIHCDLKPSNILLDHDMVAHVGDFGLARFHPRLTDTFQSSSNGIRGTIGYAAPEYGLGSEISTNGDVYSYGICLLEMMTGRRPTDGMFRDGINLHSLARMAMPDNVMEILDQVLLNGNEEEVEATENMPRQRRNRANKMKDCLVSVVKIGVACSVESPQERMKISDVVHELQSVKNKLLQH